MTSISPAASTTRGTHINGPGHFILASILQNPALITGGLPAKEERKPGPLYMQLQINSLSSSPATRLTRRPLKPKQLYQGQHEHEEASWSFHEALLTGQRPRP